MRVHRCLFVLMAALVTASDSVHGQSAPSRNWRAGLTMIQAAGTSVGPEVSRDLVESGPIGLRVQLAALTSTARPLSMIILFPGPDVDARHARKLGTFGVIGELGPVREGKRTWFLLGSYEALAVRWGSGCIVPGRSYDPCVGPDPEGTTTVAATVGVGLGREFGLFGGRGRAELRVAKVYDSNARIDLARLGVTRSW